MSGGGEGMRERERGQHRSSESQTPKNKECVSEGEHCYAAKKVGKETGEEGRKKQLLNLNRENLR